MEDSVLWPRAQRKVSGISQCSELASGNVRLSGPPGEGAAQMQEGCTDWTSPFSFEIPLLLSKNLIFQRARTGHQGKVGAQAVRRADYNDASSNCSEIWSLQLQPSGLR